MTQKDIRDTLRLVSYGLYILTTSHGSQTNAMTCNWFSQISFEPLLVVVALQKQSQSHFFVQESGCFAINFLASEQRVLAQRMAAPYRINPHKLAGVPYHPGMTGAPIIDQAIAFLECVVKQPLDVDGDHTLFVSEVVQGQVLKSAEPLTLLASGLRYK